MADQREEGIIGRRYAPSYAAVSVTELHWTVKINAFLTIVTLGYCAFCILVQKAHVAITFSRYLAGVATVFMLTSVFVMLSNIKFWYSDSGKDDVLNHARHVSRTVVVFIIALAAVTSAGYVKLVATDVVLWNFDFALDYTEPYEVFFDIIYSAIFVYFFLPLLLVYTIIYAPSYKTYKITTNILIFTLILCFLQKWAYETLTINEHICQVMLEEDGRQCDNRNETHFVTNYQNLTGRKRHLYDSLINESPYIYTCTMELLAAIGAVLVSLIRNKHTKAESNGFNGVTISPGWKTACAYTLLILSVATFFISFIGQPLLCMAYDEKEKKKTEWTLFGYGICRVIAYLLSMALFLIVYNTYKQPCLQWQNTAEDQERQIDPEHQQLNVTETGDQQPLIDSEQAVLAVRNEESPVVVTSCSSLLWNWLIFQTKDMAVILDIPDLAIMFIAGLLIFVLQILRTIVHILAYIGYYTQDPILPSLAEIFLHDIANFLQILSFFFQYQVIKTFLTFSKDSMKRLRKDKFIVRLAATSLAINVFLFGGIYLSNSNYVVPYPSNSIIFDNILSLLDSTYPFSLLFSMTAALCWAHIIERLYKAGAYRVVPEIESVANWRDSSGIQHYIDGGIQGEDYRITAVQGQEHVPFAVSSNDYGSVHDRR